MKIETGNTKDNPYIHYLRGRARTDLSVIQAGYHLTKPYYAYGPMTRDHYLIHFIQAGRGRFYIHDLIYEVNAGDCFLIRPYEMASYASHPDDPWAYNWIGFSGETAGQLIDRIGFTKSNPVLKIQHMAQIQETFRWIEHYNQSESLLYQAVLYRILHILLSEEQVLAGDGSVRPAETGSSTKHDYVEQAVTIIENSFTQNLPVSRLAEMLHLSRNYLSRIFKEITGKTITQFLTEYRLSFAVQKMTDSQLNISEIALQCGFPDALYFSRVFKKVYGTSPSEYRAQEMQS